VRGSALRDGALLAAGTLSVVPVPAPRRVDRAVAGVAMCLTPLVGVLVAAPAALVAELARRAGAGDLVAAVLAVAVLARMTGGLHLDGVADTVDGLAGAHGDVSRALEVMRRGDVGPLGAAALVLLLGLQVAALARALPIWGVWALPLASAAGRCTLPVLCARGIPAAREGGLGASVAGSVPRALALLVPLLVTGVAGLGLGSAPGVHPVGSLATAAGGLAGRADLAVAAGCTVGAVLAGRAVRRLGGVTGDVLGFAVELGTAAALVVLATG
jgi:adenosylcobinamide-GDP ribazoletransferase